MCLYTLYGFLALVSKQRPDNVQHPGNNVTTLPIKPCMQYNLIFCIIITSVLGTFVIFLCFIKHYTTVLLNFGVWISALTGLTDVLQMILF